MVYRSSGGNTQHDPMSRRGFLAAPAAGVGAAALPVRFEPQVAVRPRTVIGGKPAILGGTPVRTTPFPSWPVIGEVDEKNFLEALRKKEWSRLGARTATRFDEAWAQLLGAKYARS